MRAAGATTGAGADDRRPPGQGRALAVLAAGMLLAMTTWFSATAVLAQLRVEWRLSALEGSLLTIAVQAGFVLGALVSAVAGLADRLPPRRFMLLGAVGAATVNLLLLAIPPSARAVAIVLRVLTGVFLAGVYPPGLKAMSTWFRRGRGTALGVMVGALTLGSAAPHLVNALGGARWQVVIAVTSVLTLAGGVLVQVGVGDGPYPFPKTSFQLRRAAAALRNRGVRLASAGYFGHMWELYAVWAWLLAFYQGRLAGVVPGARGMAALLTFVAIGAGAAGCLVGGLLGDRWGRTNLTALAMACSGACCVLAGPVSHLGLWPLVAVTVFWGFWVVADSAQFSSMVTEVGDQDYVGTALTIQLALGFALTVPTIWLVPLVERWVGWTWAFAVLAPGPMLGVLAMLRLRHSPFAVRIAGGRG